MHVHALFIEQIECTGIDLAREVCQHMNRDWSSVEDRKRCRDMVFRWRERGISWRCRPLVATIAKNAAVIIPEDFLVPTCRAVSGRARATRRIDLPSGFFDPAQEPAQKAASNG